MEFVINEWYLDWHRADANLSERVSARKFLEWLQVSEHRLVLLRNSPFIDKLNHYRRIFDYDPMSKMYLKLFFSQILNNTNRCRILDEEPPLPPDIQALLKRPLENPLTNYESDRYLFQSAEATQEKMIVTTDQKLMHHFQDNGRFHLINVDEFLAKFSLHQ